MNETKNEFELNDVVTIKGNKGVNETGRIICINENNTTLFKVSNLNMTFNGSLNGWFYADELSKIK